MTTTPQHTHQDEGSGGRLLGSLGVQMRSLFGDGSDGDITITGGTTTLTRTMFYDNLIITATGILDMAGFEAYARTSILVQAGGLIHSNGADASGATGGVTVANGEVDGRQAGGDGEANADGSDGVAGDEGGAGGAGGDATATGGSPGAAGNPSTSQVRFRAPGNAVKETGSGGGGGAGDSTPGTGGGGGASGGEVSLHSPSITVEATAVISSDGGDGADGVASNGGGGGGGGGGKVRLEYIRLINNGTLRAAAGAPGAGAGTGDVGIIGNAGIVEHIID